MEAFERALAVVFLHEAGFVNDPDDSGGPTNFGLTLEDWKAYYGTDGTVDDIRGLTKETATPIYRKLYWDAMNLGLLTDFNVQLCLLDQGVLQGKATAIGKIQTLLGMKVDGVIGPITAKAINAEPGQKLAFKFIRADLHRYNAIVAEKLSQVKFLNGWGDRLFSLLDFIFFGDPA